MNPRAISHFFCLIALAVSPLAAPAQNPPQSSNADIIAMIQARLPESSIVNKIREGAGHWDTSVKALIAIKQAGGTDTEIEALTTPRNPVAIAARPTAEMPGPLPGSLSGQSDQQGANIDLRTLRLVGVPVRPLPEVPSEVEDKLIEKQTRYFKGKDKSNYARLIRSIFDDCRTQPGAALPRNRVADQCDRLTSYFVGFLGDDPQFFGAWEGKHQAYVPLIQGLMDSSRMRGCALGNAEACWGYGKTLVALGNMEAARVVWQTGPCIEHLQCKQALDNSYLNAEDRQRSEIAQEQDRRDARNHEGIYTLPPQPRPDHSTLMAVMSGLSQGLSNASEILAQPTAIETAKNQQLGNINAAAARDVALQAQQAEAARQAAAQAAAARQAEVPTRSYAASASNGCNNSNQACKATGAPPAGSSANRASASANAGPTYYASSAPTPSTTSSTGTGTVAPADCVAVNVDGPCIPLAQWQQYQAEIQAAPTSVAIPYPGAPTPWPKVMTNLNFYAPRTANTHICPSAGYINTGRWAAADVWEAETIPCRPGVQIVIDFGTPGTPFNSAGNSGGGNICPASGWIMVQTGDVSTGHQCTPGQPVAGSSSSSGSSGASSGGGTSSGGFPSIAPLTDCISQSFVNDDLHVSDICNVPVYVAWFINGRGGSWNLDPGGNVGVGYTSAQIASASASYYVCPKGTSPVDGSGRVLTSAASSYRCRRF